MNPLMTSECVILNYQFRRSWKCYNKSLQLRDIRDTYLSIRKTHQGSLLIIEFHGEH